MPNPIADVAWAETNVMTRMATRLVGEEQYLGRQSSDLGTRVAEHAHELFTMIAPAETLALHFERQSPTFIALHDIGAATSSALVAGLGAALRQPVQTLTIRQQGSGVTLAVLRFFELPSSRGVPVRVWATACEADAANRRAIAETLLAFSRLGVLLVNALSDHMLVTQLGQLRERLLAQPWPNRDLLLIPRAGFAHLADHAQRLVEGTLVATSCAEPSAQTAGIWHAIQGVWGRLRAGGSAAPARSAPAAPEPMAPPAGMPTITLRPFGSPPPAVASPTAPTVAAPSVPAAPEPSVVTAATPATSAEPFSPPASWGSPVPVPAPAPRLDAAGYAAACAAQPGVLACVVFDTGRQAILATAGGAADPARGCAGYAMLLAAARGSGHGVDHDAAPLEVVAMFERQVTLVRPLPGHAPWAVAVVLERAQAGLDPLRAQLERLDAQLVQ